jgi:glycosyltransferase involved in cell wall biosynthesis
MIEENHEITTIESLISIVVITYNSSKYVLETLESAKAQTYQNIELIISDDCSTDDTVEICQKWIDVNKESFVRTELITTLVNAGIPVNCNRGLKAANGKWVKLIAGDDILLESCIQDNLTFLNSNPSAKFIASGLEFIDEKGNKIEMKSISQNSLKNYYFTLNADKQLKFYARVPLFLNSPSFFIEKQALIDIEYLDEEFSIFEDTCLIYKINEKGWKVYYLDRLTVKYRITDTSASRNNNKKEADFKFNELKSVFKKYRIKYLSRLNIIDLSICYDFWLYDNYKDNYKSKWLMILKRLSVSYWYFIYLKMKLLKFNCIDE